jgi:hypothetical protein
VEDVGKKKVEDRNLPFESTALQMRGEGNSFNDMLPHALSNSPGIVRPPTPKKPFVMPEQFIESEEE